MRKSNWTPSIVFALVFLGPVPMQAQERPRPDSTAIRLAHCLAGSLPIVKQAVDSARPPLLFVGEERLGPVRRIPACPEPKAFDDLPQVRFIRPSSARKLYGDEAGFGAITMDTWPTTGGKIP